MLTSVSISPCRKSVTMYILWTSILCSVAEANMIHTETNLETGANVSTKSTPANWRHPNLTTRACGPDGFNWKMMYIDGSMFISTDRSTRDHVLLLDSDS